VVSAAATPAPDPVMGSEPQPEVELHAEPAAASDEG